MSSSYPHTSEWEEDAGRIQYLILFLPNICIRQPQKLAGYLTIKKVSQLRGFCGRVRG